MKNLRKILLAGLAALCISVTAGAVAGCKGDEPTAKLPDDVGGVVITVEGSSPADSLGTAGDVCLCAESGKLYRKTAQGWVEAAYESCDVDGTSLTVIYQDGSVGTYALTSEDETHECTHENLESVEPVAVYEAKCVIPGIGVKTCPVCHESFPVILPATGEHRYEKNGYTCLDCNETDYFKDGQEVTGDEENPEGYFVVKNVPQVMIEDGSIEIPGHIHGLPVIIGSNAFTSAEKSTLTSVILDEGVVEIQASAFGNCSKLTSVILPETLTEIGEQVFYFSSALEKITIPASVEKIGEFAFMRSGIQNITFEEGALTEIPASCFSLCKKLQTVDLPSGIKTIGAEAFAACSSLNHIKLSESLVTISKAAFKNASNLTSIELPQSVEVIEDMAFCVENPNSSNLNSIVIPEGSHLKQIGSGEYPAAQVFMNCKALSSVDLRNATELEMIYSGAFYQCDNLSEVSLPETSKLWEGAFYKSGLTTINFTNPEKIETIEKDVFKNTNLTNFTMPGNVKEIGIDAFKHSGLYEDSTNWKDIYAGDTLKWKAFSVGDCLLEIKAVDGLTMLKRRDQDEKEYEIEEEYTLKLPEGTRVVATSIFRDTDFTKTDQDSLTPNTFYKLVIPYTVQYLSTAAFTFSAPPLSNYNPDVVYIFEIEDTEEHPSQLISIGSRAFLTAGGIGTYINIPDSVKHIGADAMGCLTPSQIDPSSLQFYSTLPYSIERTSGSSPWYHYYTFHTEHVKISTENWRTADMTSEELQKDHPNTWEEGETSITQYYMDEERTKPVSEFWYCLYTGVELFRD